MNIANRTTGPSKKIKQLNNNYKIILKNFTDFRLEPRSRQKFINRILKTFQANALEIDRVEAQISDLEIRKEANPEALGKEIFAAFSNSLLGVDLTKDIAQHIKIFSGEVIALLLFFVFLLSIVGFLIPPLQSLYNNAEQFSNQTYSENVTTENLRLIVHTIKEALNTAREFWDNA